MKSLLFVTKIGRPGRPLAWLLLAGAAALAACSPLQLLRPGQRLLSKMSVVGPSRANEERLLALAQQKPNTRFPLPKLAIYRLGNKFYDSVRTKKQLVALRRDFDRAAAAVGPDSAKLGKLLARRERRLNRKQLVLDKGNAVMRLGEAPVIYDSAATRRSVEQMTTFLRSQGYFRARVVASDTARYRHDFLLRAFTSPITHPAISTTRFSAGTESHLPNMRPSGASESAMSAPKMSHIRARGDPVP